MIGRIFPIFDLLRQYRQEHLRGDLSAGLTVAILLVPQGMAYAMLAGLPPVVGLYASTLPLIIYAAFGSSRHLAVGPVAMISLLVFTACSKLAEPGSQHYVTHVLTLTLMVGALQLAAGLLRLGFVANFFSHAVLSGFTSAAAIVICLSQLGHLLGVKLASNRSALPLLWDAIQKSRQANPATLGIGLVSVSGLCLFKKKWPRFPAPILFVVGGTLLVYLVGLEKYGVTTIGNVPGGLPSLTVGAIDLASIRQLLPVSLAIFFVGYMESISVGQYVADREKYEIDPNRELSGLGLANIVSSFFSGYPVTGGFSRTAVNYQAGARTGLASIVTALLVILTLLTLTTLFYYLPNTVLAAIIIVAVGGLVDAREALRLFKLKSADGWGLLITFFCTLTLGAERGILIGVVFSLILFIWRSAHPHIAELGYLEKDGVFRNINRFPEARTFPEALILRIDASLYFANLKFVEDKLRNCIADKPDLKWFIIDLSGVNDIDAVAIRTLEELMVSFGQREIRFIFCSMKGPVRDLVTKAGWDNNYREQLKYPSIQHALQAIGSSL